MRRDSLFYRLFQQSPSLLFELLATPPVNAPGYRFDSVAVKEPKFEIDGVFLPPDDSEIKTVYFCEVQFQKDDALYERLFGESFLYFYRQRHRFDDWQAVIIYPSRSIEQQTVHPYRALLNSDQVHRIYLKELGNPEQLPLGIGLLVLTTLTEAQSPEQARTLLRRTRQEIPAPDQQQAIIDLITTIMVYQFTHMSHQEVKAMLGLTLQDTRVYQEGREEGREEILLKTRTLVVRLLTRKVGILTDELTLKVEILSIDQLEDLGEVLFDFSSLADLETWISQLQLNITDVVQQLTQSVGPLDESTSNSIQLLSLERLAVLKDCAKSFTDVNGLVEWLRQ